MASTLAEKIIARASGSSAVSPGEIVTCRVDLAMIHDSGGPRRVQPMLDQLERSVWDRERVVVVSDHYAPAVDADSAAILRLTRDWVARERIHHFYDMRGICHIVLPEHGHLQPGFFVVGGDSHSPTGGAFGCFMFGVGATDMVGVLAQGEIWIKVPASVEIRWDGNLAPAVTAKDMMLATCARFGLGGIGYHAIEYCGTTIATLDQQERMTLCNMAAELGAQTGLIAPDETTLSALRAAEQNEPVDCARWQSDPNAEHLARHRFHAEQLVPQIAAPHSPANASACTDFIGTRIDQAYIGACTGAKLIDLQHAAELIGRRQIAHRTRLLIAPASAATLNAASQDGTLQTLLTAGATLLPTGCGACAGYGAGVLASGETCLASTARNFQGRMGATDAAVFLGSPYSVAAAAIAGEICDPREFLE